MAQEPEDKERPEGNRWKYPVSALIIIVALGLTIYTTYRTGEVPYTILTPLIVAALWALLNFNANDFRGGGKP